MENKWKINGKYLINFSKYGVIKKELLIDMSYIFYECSSLKELPDISIWNMEKINNISFMFYSCSSLTSLPDISKWNTENILNMNSLFNECSSLKSLPDILKVLIICHICLENAHH